MTRAAERLILTFSGNGRKPANWAGALCGKLGLDLSAPGQRLLPMEAPGGGKWTLRLTVADREPEPLARPPADRPDEAELLDPPVVSGQYESNATVTALTIFSNCPRAYYLGQYLGFHGERSGGRSEDLSAAELGSQTHALLAGQPVPDADPEAERLAAVFRASTLGRRAARATRAEREFDFLIAVGDLAISGQVDLWFEEGGELALVDYKTDDVTRAQAHERAQAYALQLRLYAVAVERATGRAPGRAYLHFLRPNTAVEIDLAPTLLDAPDLVVRQFQEAQAALDFPMAPGERCHRCPFVHDLCPAVI